MAFGALDVTDFEYNDPGQSKAIKHGMHQKAFHGGDTS